MKGLYGLPKYCQGFSLIEVLISLVILAIGLLGLAMLQVSGFRYLSSAHLQYQAMLQASDMADRIRANPVGVENGAYDHIEGVGVNPNCITINCSPAQIAQTDQFEWNTQNAFLFPQGRGTVLKEAEDYLIDIEWSAQPQTFLPTETAHFTLRIRE